MKKLIAALCLILGACAAPSHVLVNDQGQYIRCSAAGWGWAGAPLALMSEQGCVNDALAVGFRPVN